MKDMVLAVLHGVLPSIAAGLLLVGLFGRRCIGLTLGIGLFTAYALLKQELPRWPHELWTGNNDGMQWLVWSVLAAGLCTLGGSGRLPPRWTTIPGGALLLAAQVWLMLGNRREQMGTGEAVLQHGLAIVLIVAVWLLLRRAASARAGVGLPIVWTGCFVGDSCVLLASGSALQAQLAGTAAAALGTAVGTALWRRPFAIGGPAALALASVHGGLLLAGYHFSNLPAWPALAAMMAPAGMVLAARTRGTRGSRGNGSKTLFAAGLSVTAGLVTIAVGLVLAAQP